MFKEDAWQEVSQSGLDFAVADEEAKLGPKGRVMLTLRVLELLCMNQVRAVIHSQHQARSSSV